ncbi:MAG: DUF2914 domain-containing protein [Thermodesulfobacteriota bacterium]
MKTKSALIIAIIMLLPVLGMAQEGATITVDDIQICTGVQERQPVGAGEAFARDIGQLYCFTKLSAGQDSASVSHVWYYNDKETLKVALNMGAKTWRTWSVKQIPNTMTGQWRVDVVAVDGAVLTSKAFTINE